MANPDNGRTPQLSDEDRERLAAAAGAGTGELPTLAISPEKVCFLLFKAREFDVKDVTTISNEGSDGPDDAMRSVLEDRPDDPVREELTGFINALTVDEQVDLVTLMWMGRGDGTIDDWYEMRDTALGAHNARTARYLLGTPLLGDYLAEGLAQFGRNCNEFVSGR